MPLSLRFGLWVTVLSTSHVAIGPEADPHVRLRNFYEQATQSNDTIAEAQTEYADIAAEVFALEPFKDTRCTAWIESLLEAVEEGPGVPFSGSTTSGVVTGRSRIHVEGSTINEDYLSSLSSRFKRARNRLVRYDADWQSYFAKHLELKTLSFLATQKLVFRFKNTTAPYCRLSLLCCD